MISGALTMKTSLRLCWTVRGLIPPPPPPTRTLTRPPFHPHILIHSLSPEPAHPSIPIPLPLPSLLFLEYHYPGIPPPPLQYVLFSSEILLAMSIQYMYVLLLDRMFTSDIELPPTVVLVHQCLHTCKGGSFYLRP